MLSGNVGANFLFLLAALVASLVNGRRLIGSEQDAGQDDLVVALVLLDVGCDRQTTGGGRRLRDRRSGGRRTSRNHRNGRRIERRFGREGR